MSYQLLEASILVGQNIQPYLEKIGDSFNKKFDKYIVITSGTRSSNEQASAMHKNFVSEAGTSIQKGKYRNQTAFDEIATKYEVCKNQSPSQCIAEIQIVIDGQIKQGTHISQHLIDSAVDIRTRGFSENEVNFIIKEISNFSSYLKFQDKRNNARPHIHIQMRSTETCKSQ